MGSLWDGDDEIKPMEKNSLVDCADTEPIDTQISSPPLSDEKGQSKDADELVRDIVPCDDTVPVEDAFETQMVDFSDETQLMDFATETQVMDFGGETQVLDLGGETQAMDFGGETQATDFGGETQAVDFSGETQVLDDINCFANMEDTQLLEFDDVVVSDSEESDATEVLDDSKDLTDNESVRRGSDQLMNGENICRTPCENSENGLTEQANHLVDKQHNAGLHVSAATPVDDGSPELGPGSVHMQFTSVRAASLQASGLAACSTALNGTNSESRSVPSNNQSLNQLSGKDNAVSLLGGSTIDGGKVNEEHDSRNENKWRTGSSTARKLFTEDSDAENTEISHNSASDEEAEDLLQFPSNFAGLSYIDSQEPGELSQANALDFVDKFLQNNLDESNKEVGHGKSARDISKFVSSAKGPQTLAKKANEKSIDKGIFDWDDNREDEEGGEFFHRRKADFFDGGSHGWRSLPQPQKSKEKRQDVEKDCKKQLQGKNKRIGVVHSDSKLLLHNSKVDKKTAHEDEMKHIKNLVSEFDEQFNNDSPREQLDANINKNDAPEMMNVGFDTQMAAEAMEALCYGEGISNCDASDDHQDAQGNQSCPEGSMGEKSKNRTCSTKLSSRKRGRLTDAGVSRETRQAKKSRVGRKECETKLVIAKSKKGKSNAKKHLNIIGNRNMEKMPSVAIGLRAEGSIKKHLQQDVGTFKLIAHRTRRSMVVNQLKKADDASSDCGEESSSQSEDVATREKIISFTGVQVSNALNAKSSKSGPNRSGEVGNHKPSQHHGSDLKFEAICNGIKLDALSFPKGKRSRRKLSDQVYGPDNLNDPPTPSVHPDKVGQHVTRHTRLQGAAQSIFVDVKSTRRTRSATRGDKNCARKLAHHSLKTDPWKAPLRCNSSHKDGIMISEITTGGEAVGILDRMSDANPSSATKMRDESPLGKCKPLDSACATPVNSKVPVNDASPVCMGNEYFKQSCKKTPSRPSLLKEIRDLSANGHAPTSASKDLRKRRDMTDVRVLYSHHLDDYVIKHQKKILARLGVSVASSMTDATHFIADQFVRTRNMLEAIAAGKPVVTHLWLDSCGQASCFIDEKNYVLRDTKKEKEFGFNMPTSLVRACQHPLLEGRKVFITPNTKPGKEIISSLVKAVHGQAIERIGRSVLEADKIPDDLLVLSCEEDYEICVPLLEKGATVYSSELLLNGIVTQKLEFERHRLFTDQVKKTRSTIWLRKDGSKFLPVTKNK
ncbi:uncharacterized protein LOC103958544 isoform X2 [Pyrus x bretschneideri]|uniref:uncharacterized protein LOC103958544 isoform X2 n=1 Tax=Pyrus x bretschneideri TaxID=225117 RepID=UPI00202EFBD8|nr:uncharacterized protein LOC103958544 isoform X2 [Pyrus x bretschneideri]